MAESESSNVTIRRLILGLRQSPLADRIVVVGSVARGSPEPRDLDAVVLLPEWSTLGGLPPEVSNEVYKFLRWSARAYGLFDPFLLLRDGRVLLVRNDRANDWERSKLRASSLLEPGVSVREVRLPPKTPPR
jgi:predicted nucleotidyltransferase